MSGADCAAGGVSIKMIFQRALLLVFCFPVLAVATGASRSLREVALGLWASLRVFFVPYHFRADGV